MKRFSERVTGAGVLNRAAFALVLIVACGSTAMQPCMANDQVYLQIYDVSDLVRPVRHFVAPRLGLTGLEEESSELSFADEAEESGWTTDQIVELLRRHLGIGEGKNTAGIQIEKLRTGQIAITSPQEGLDLRVAQALGKLREERVDTYVVNAWLLHVANEDLAAIGLGKNRSKTRAVVDRASVSEHITAATEKSLVLAAPTVTVAAKQKAAVSVIDQVSYVGDYEITEVDGRSVADPIVQTLKQGLTLEVTVKRVPRDAKRFLLQWNATVCDTVLPFPAATVQVGDQSVEVELPEVSLKSTQGRVAIAADQAVALLGLDPGPRANDGVRTVLVMTVDRVLTGETPDAKK